MRLGRPFSSCAAERAARMQIGRRDLKDWLGAASWRRASLSELDRAFRLLLHPA